MKKNLAQFTDAAPVGYWGYQLASIRQLAHEYGVDGSAVRSVIEHVGKAAREYSAEADLALSPNGLRSGNSNATTGHHQAQEAAAIRPRDTAAQQMRNWLALAWVLDPIAALQRLRKDGLLRASTWDWQTAIPKILVDDAVQLSLALHREKRVHDDEPTNNDDALSEVCRVDAKYLESLRTLWALAPKIRRIEAAHLEALRREGQQGIFGLLSTVELIYANQGPPPSWKGRWPNGLATGVNDPFGEIALTLVEAATYAIRRFSQIVGPIALEDRRRPTNGKLVEKGIYLTQLASWALSTRAREWEELVDVHAYRATYTSRRAILVEPSSELYEKSIRHGFLQAEQQQVVAALTPNNKDLSLADFTRQFLREYPQLLRAMRIDEPFPRYVIEFAAYDRILPLLRTEAVFAEEAAMLETNMAEHVLRPDEIRSFEIADGVTLWDLILVQRLFRLMNVTVREAIGEDVRSALPTVVHSMLPTFSKEELGDLLRAAIGKEPDGVITFLTANELDSRFDLHYQPLLALSNRGYVLCSFLLGHANLIRNSWQVSQRRAHVGKTPDPSEVALSEVIRAVGGDASVNVKFSYQGLAGDFDVLACLDGECVAIEFKRALFPGSVRELRGSLDPMQKAATQLDRLQAAWALPDFRRTLSEKLAAEGWSQEGLQAIRGSGTLHTAIVLSNRMFSGWRERGHPVRGINELLSFLLDGAIRLRLPDEIAELARLPREHSIRTWSGKQVCGADLRRYLADDLIHGAMLESMLPITRTVEVGNTQVIESTFALELITLGQQLKERFGPTPP